MHTVLYICVFWDLGTGQFYSYHPWYCTGNETKVPLPVKQHGRIWLSGTSTGKHWIIGECCARRIYQGQGRMMTSSNGNISASLTLCAGNSPVNGEFPAQRPVTRSLDVFFDLRLNKRLSKHSWGWWFETAYGPLWRHCNGVITSHSICGV